MDATDQSGTSLAEAIVAAAVAAIAIGGALAATVPALHKLSPDPHAVALAQAASRELARAVDVAKYTGSTVVPNAIATTIPLSGASPFPARLTLRTTPTASGLTVDITATSADGTATSDVRATVIARAPQPGATFAPGATVPAPTGAP